MGWASGSSVLVDVWQEVRQYIPKEDRVEVLANLMVVFAKRDCDTLDEVIRRSWPESEAAYDKYMR